MQEKPRRTLSELAAQIERQNDAPTTEEYRARVEESNRANAEWAAHKDEFARVEAEQERAAFLSDPDYQAHLAEMREFHEDEPDHPVHRAAPTVEQLAATPLGGEVPPYVLDEEHGVVASPARVRAALENGGRAIVTVRSHRTGRHVCLNFVVRKRKPGGQGWVSRATRAGRVGLAEGDAIEVRDPELEYPDNYVGRYYLDDQAWRAGRSADGARVYSAEKVLDYALSGVLMQSEVFLATQCSYCGHGLRDPESIERGIGPECYGRHTSSRMARHGEVE